MTFSELREHIQIVDFAQRYGYSSLTPWAKSKRSRNYPALENTDHNDRVIINRIKNRYTEAGATRSGDLIDFVKKRIAIIAPHKAAMVDYAAVNEVLHEYLNIAHELTPQKQEPALTAKRGFDPTLFLKSATLRKENISYLQREGIALSTINDTCFAGKIISVKNPIVDKDGVFSGKHYRYYNVSFPYVLRAGGPTVGFEQRNVSYKGHALDSNKDSGLWLSNLPDNGKVDAIVVTESAKDCLSYHQLHKPNNPLYVSLGGHLTSNQVETLKSVFTELKTASNPSIIVGFDNDVMGAVFTLQLLCGLAQDIGSIMPHGDDKALMSLILPSPNKRLSQLLNNFNKSIRKNSDYQDTRFFSEVSDTSFIIQVPKRKQQLHFLVESIVSAYGISDVIMHIPVSKDFNDDLKHFLNKGKVLANKPQNPKNAATQAY
ncbi:toprim domain-containing protein [Parapedobacter sp. 10938]|uniref:toprim domain-containing protein n=1 Tax=Parapedobacter flavus TaxID=3110225 RepID=UPI002DB86080|nr:toprim domain-containing protein [Parapedobacter sp. 10938]MEC3881817.1 toprim domain-containing protein [Parapedobacter sp. 10938]